MNIWEYFDKHDFIAFCAIILALSAVGKCAFETITLFKLPLRAVMVAKAGWPPEYLDADGDSHHKTEPGDGQP